MKKSNQKSLLIIFVKKPEAGKVKTRLAETVGTENALRVYKALLSHTREVSLAVEVDREVHYATEMDNTDGWSPPAFKRLLQPAGDLGERMKAGFCQGFNAKYSSIIVIGSDCLDLSPKLLREAFFALESKEIVIGPALDGGYYLLGMKSFFPELFENKSWSTERVFQDTLSDVKRLGLTCFQLPVLSDIDREEDLTGTQLENLIKK